MPVRGIGKLAGLALTVAVISVLQIGAAGVASAAETTTAQIGNTGATGTTESTTACTNGTNATAIVVYTNTDTGYTRGVQLICGSGTSPYAGGTNTNGSASGTSTCPSGEYAMGIYGRSGAVVDQIGARCQSSPGSTPDSAPGVGDLGGSPIGPADCPSGQRLVGLNVWWGDYLGEDAIKSVQGICSGPAIACDQVITGTRASLTVTSGTTCLRNATITGGISVARGATLDIENSTVQGSISANHPAGLRICGSTTGGISVSGATGYVSIGDPASNCAPNTINGGLTAANNTGGGTIAGNTITGSWTVTNNTPAFTVTGNHH
jgi:hypothetical protein